MFWFIFLIENIKLKFINLEKKIFPKSLSTSTPVMIVVRFNWFEFHWYFISAFILNHDPYFFWNIVPWWQYSSEIDLVWPQSKAVFYTFVVNPDVLSLLVFAMLLGASMTLIPERAWRTPWRMNRLFCSATTPHCPLTQAHVIWPKLSADCSCTTSETACRTWKHGWLCWVPSTRHGSIAMAIQWRTTVPPCCRLSPSLPAITATPSREQPDTSRPHNCEHYLSAADIYRVITSWAAFIFFFLWQILWSNFFFVHSMSVVSLGVVSN